MRLTPIMRCVCVAGARPNYMKVKPVMDALEERGSEVVLVHTGQHYDAAMSDVFFSDAPFEVRIVQSVPETEWITSAREFIEAHAVDD